jgi:probable O-glycosylation ligase (exosortase A-associated)
MRDILLAAFLLGSVPFILRRPALGVFLWVWVSVMNPHRMAYGFAYDFPFAQIIAIATLVGMFFSGGIKRLPLTPVTVVLFLMTIWMNVTTYFALDTDQAMPMWERVMKIELMVFVSVCALYSKKHIETLIWVVAGSVAFFGVKGGLFTLLQGGEYRVYGPTGSFIEDNNSLALATVMTIPLLYYLASQVTRRWLRWGLFVAMLLCGLSALGSYSRGGLLAIVAMAAFLWLKSRSKLTTGVVLITILPVAVWFMPEKWEERMWSIGNYDEDASSLGRINAWKMATNLANDRPLVGGGFEIYNDKVFARYAPNATDVHAAHSIYFQMLGEHGYVGLLLFLLLWFLVWRDAASIIRNARSHKDLQWAVDLARMIQVSLVGYAVGGSFLNLAYYDVPYNLIAALILTRVLIEKEIKSLEESKELAAGQKADAAGSADQPPDSRVPFGPQMSPRKHG